MQLNIIGLTFMLKVSRCRTRQYTINIVSYQVRLVLAAIEQNWLLFVENLCYCRRIVWSEIIIGTYQLSAVLGAIEKQWANFVGKRCCWLFAFQVTLNIGSFDLILGLASAQEK